MKNIRISRCVALTVVMYLGLVASCTGNGAEGTSRYNNQPSDETVAEVSISEQQIAPDESEEQVATESCEEALQSTPNEYVDLSNLYGRSTMVAAGYIDQPSRNQDGSLTSIPWGVYIFPECEITVTGEREDELYDPGDILTDYSVNCPVIDTGSGYEFNCSICYPEIVAGDQWSLSGRSYTLTEEDWGDSDTNVVNPHVTCTYLSEDGNTYSASNLLSPEQETCLYNEDGLLFVVCENVRLFIPYENAGDLYDTFIEPALNGTIETASPRSGRYSSCYLANCYKINFDENGVITCLENHCSPSRDYYGYPAEGSVRSDGMTVQLYEMSGEEWFSDMSFPDVMVLFEVPVTVNDNEG